MPHSMPRSDLLQRSQADLQWPTLFPYRNCGKIDGRAVLLPHFNCGAEETKQYERSEQISQRGAVWRKLRNFGPAHTEIPAWLCGSCGSGEAAPLPNPSRLRLDFES